MSRHLEGDVLQDECVGRHLRASQSLKIRPEPKRTYTSLRAHTICVEFLYFIQIQHVKYNKGGLLFIGAGALENKKPGWDGKH